MLRLYTPPLTRTWRRFRLPPVARYTMTAASEVVRDPVALVGALLLIALLVMAMFAPQVAPFDPTDKEILRRLAPPFWMAGAEPGHILGTDALGRDILSRIIFGARPSWP